MKVIIVQNPYIGLNIASNRITIEIHFRDFLNSAALTIALKQHLELVYLGYKSLVVASLDYDICS